ncbi:MAG TPA: APC family permease [Tepidisphaeraceae bacterium]
MALALLSSERPRNVGWLQASGLLFGDWGTSRLYVLGLAFLFAGRTSFWLILFMSLLIVAVGWAYTQICRIYPDGGGVYTAAKSKSRTLAVVGALLLFADYTVTASLSALDAFHYFGLPLQHHAQVEEGKKAAAAAETGAKNAPADASSASNQPAAAVVKDAGDEIKLHHDTGGSVAESLLAWDSPGLWAIIAVAVIGIFNLMGPKHTGGFALAAAVGMVAITLLIAGFALPQVEWSQLPSRVGHLSHSPAHLWVAFVSIVLALSGVEAIANLTGVMQKPVAHTARKAISVVTAEVAIFNLLLCVAMVAIPVLDREAHFQDMLAFLSSHYVGQWAEWGVRILGGLLLLSACNTALTDMISLQYLMARDGELPQWMTALNRFGVPYVPALIAASVPMLVLLISHDLERLAALYAIGVIGAVAINVTLCSTHPRLRRMRRKIPMLGLGIILLAIWITLACTKLHALAFVTIVMLVGLSARQLNKWLTTRKGPRPSLLRQAIMDQLTPEALGKPKILIGTYGSEALAPVALAEAKKSGCTLVVCFVREVNLSYKYDSEQQLTIDTDLAAQKAFSRFLDMGHAIGVPIIPIYDTGPNAPELMAENAAIYGVDRILIGTSRRGAIYHLIKGHFQRRLEALLPPEIPVQVVSVASAPEPPSADSPAATGMTRER